MEEEEQQQVDVHLCFLLPVDNGGGWESVAMTQNPSGLFSVCVCTYCGCVLPSCLFSSLNSHNQSQATLDENSLLFIYFSYGENYLKKIE